MSVDNRQHQRLPREEKIFVEILSSSSNDSKDNILLECSTRDISQNGLKIQLEYPLLVGSILELLIQFESGGYKFLLTGEVKWFEEARQGEFIAGFELIDAEHSDFLVWKKMF